MCLRLLTEQLPGWQQHLPVKPDFCIAVVGILGRSRVFGGCLLTVLRPLNLTALVWGTDRGHCCVFSSFSAVLGQGLTHQPSAQLCGRGCW